MYGQETNISFLFGGIGSFQLENSNCCNKSRAEQQLGFLASRTSAEGGHWLSRARAGTEIARHVYLYRYTERYDISLGHNWLYMAVVHKRYNAA